MRWQRHVSLSRFTVKRNFVRSAQLTGERHRGPDVAASCREVLSRGADPGAVVVRSAKRRAEVCSALAPVLALGRRRWCSSAEELHLLDLDRLGWVRKRQEKFSPMVAVYYDLSYTASAYDFPTTRKAVWIADSLISNPIPGITLAPPPPLTEDDLLTVHDLEYVRAVRTGEPRDLAESNEFRWDTGLWPMVLASNGGTVAAALLRCETESRALSPVACITRDDTKDMDTAHLTASPLLPRPHFPLEPVTLQSSIRQGQNEWEERLPLFRSPNMGWPRNRRKTWSALCPARVPASGTRPKVWSKSTGRLRRIHLRQCWLSRGNAAVVEAAANGLVRSESDHRFRVQEKDHDSGDSPGSPATTAGFAGRRRGGGGSGDPRGERANIPAGAGRPRPTVTGVPKAGRLKGQLVVPDDFDEPLEELQEYME